MQKIDITSAWTQIDLLTPCELQFFVNGGGVIQFFIGGTSAPVASDVVFVKRNSEFHQFDAGTVWAKTGTNDAVKAYVVFHPYVGSGGGGGGSGSSIVSTTQNYKAIANGTGYSIGDYVQHLTIMDLTTGTTTHTWTNLKTGLNITPAPPLSNLTIVSSNGLTDAELRATPVDVTIKNPLGQKTMADSVPVVLASDQTELNIAGSLKTPTLTAYSNTTGSTLAGLTLVSIANTGTTPIIVMSAPVPPYAVITYDADKSDTLDVITFDCTGGSCLVQTQS